MEGKKGRKEWGRKERVGREGGRKREIKRERVEVGRRREYEDRNEGENVVKGGGKGIEENRKGKERKRLKKRGEGWIKRERRVK